MAEVTGSIGNEAVELNNAATEATLRLLLQSSLTANKQTVDEIKRLASKTFKIDEKSLEKFDSALKNSTSSSGLLTSSLGFVGSGFKILGGTVGVVEGAFTKLTGIFGTVFSKMAEGGGKVSDLTKPLEMLPGPLGALGKVVNSLIQYQERNLEVYQQLSDSGVKFGGNLTQMRLAAQSTYMTLDDFTKVMKSNSETFAKLGGTVDGGSRAFVNLSNSLLKSEAGNELRSLGYTTTQVNEGLATYLSVTGGRTRQELQNTTAITNSAKEYLTQLDALAEITGKSREEQEKQLKEQQANAAYEAYLQTLDEEGRKKATLAMQNALAVGGKAGADLLKSQLLGLPPMTEAAQKLQALGPNVAAGINKMGVAVSTVGATVTDVNQGYAQAQAGATQDIQRLGGTVKALSFGSDSTAQALMSLQAQANRNTAQGIKNQEDVMKQFSEIANRRREVAASEAAAVVNAQKAFQDFSQSIMNVVMPIIGNFATKLMSFIGNNLPAIQEAFEILAVYVGDFAKNLFSEEGRAKIMNDIQYYFSLMMIELKRATLGKIGLYSEETAKRDKALLDQEKAVYDNKAAVKRIEVENAKSQLALEYKNNVDGKKDKIDAKLKEDEILEKEIQEKIKQSQQNLSRNQNLTAAEKLAEQQKIEANTKELDSVKKRILQNQELIAISKGEGLESKVEKARQEKEKLTNEGKTAKETLVSKKEEKEQVESKKSEQAIIGAASGAVTGAAIGSVVPVLGTLLGGVVGGIAGYAYGSLKEPTKLGREESKPFTGLETVQKEELPYAQSGGIFSGPMSGYPVMLHGDETVIPKERLDKLVQLIGGSGLDVSTDLTKSLSQSLTNLPPMNSNANSLVSEKSTSPIINLSPITEEMKKMMELVKPSTENLPPMPEEIKKFVAMSAQPSKSEPDLMTRFNNLIGDLGKKITTAVTTPEVPEKSTPEMISSNIKSSETLLNELQILNRQTTEMIRHLRETADNSRRNVDAIKSLNGDLFRM